MAWRERQRPGKRAAASAVSASLARTGPDTISVSQFADPAAMAGIVQMAGGASPDAASTFESESMADPTMSGTEMYGVGIRLEGVNVFRPTGTVAAAGVARQGVMTDLGLQRYFKQNPVAMDAEHSERTEFGGNLETDGLDILANTGLGWEATKDQAQDLSSVNSRLNSREQHYTQDACFFLLFTFFDNNCMCRFSEFSVSPKH